MEHQYHANAQKTIKLCRGYDLVGAPHIFAPTTSFSTDLGFLLTLTLS